VVGKRLRSKTKVEVEKNGAGGANAIKEGTRRPGSWRKSPKRRKNSRLGVGTGPVSSTRPRESSVGVTR